MNNALCVRLDSLEDTARLGRVLAEMATRVGTRLILLYGSLGAGKTTLVRCLTENLPGGGEAEVCSPSFTLCNEYPTCPEILHFDLYRTEEGHMEESFLEALERLGSLDAPLVIVEWAERVCPCDHRNFPASYLACSLTEKDGGRTANIASPGADRKRNLDFLRCMLKANNLPEQENYDVAASCRLRAAQG